MSHCAAHIHERTVWMLASPVLWPTWPFLPVVRRRAGCQELGVVFDARGACGLTGHSATVYLSNLFALPSTLSDFLALPREVFDSADELADGLWEVD